MAAGIIRLGKTRGLFSTALRSSRCPEQIERFGGPMKRVACLAAVAGAMAGVILYVASAPEQTNADLSDLRLMAKE
jgi:hypothetical protein